MAIPETQLETWAHLGSVTQSAETYGIVKRALEAADAPYAGKAFNVFLQGSYANATNIWADSDVDVVMQLGSCFYFDESALPEWRRAARAVNRAVADYGFPEFKRDVLVQLRKCFDQVEPGPKAVFLAESGSRRDADVLVAVNFRKVFIPPGQAVPHYWEGLCFFTPDGQRGVNYPRLHAANCTAKHQATSQWFKPMVRILKNMRNRCVEGGLLAAGAAPSYFLESMLHNVPDVSFGGTYGATFANTVNWLVSADSTSLLCANGQYPLVDDTSPVTWRKAQLDAYLSAVTQLWNGW